jgi:transcriptional regulator with XRE-family HTH domain
MSVATIGSALAEKRTELGLDKGGAAERVGMSRTSYSSYEQDAQRPSVDVFPALAKFLNISIEDLLTLYGATCVAAARSSLGRTVVNVSDETAKVTDESVVVSDAPVPAETSTEPVMVAATSRTEEPVEVEHAARSIDSEGASPREKPSGSLTPEPGATVSASSDHATFEGSSPVDDVSKVDDRDLAVSNKKKKKNEKKKKRKTDNGV